MKKMNRQIIAKELLKIAKELVAMDFPSHKELMDYLKEHPGAHREKHRVVQYHDNGRKEYELNYKGDKQHGKQHGWYENGKREYKQNYKDGKLHGKQQGWHYNGKQKYEYNYVDGKQHGKTHDWHYNGQKESEGNFKDDKRHGRHTSWNKKGEKYFVADFENGNKINEMRFEDGKRIDG